MTTSPAGPSAEPAALASQPGSAESILDLEVSALRDYRAALSADLLQRMEQLRAAAG